MIDVARARKEAEPLQRELVFDIKELTVSYGRLTAISNVGLEIYRNVITAVIGPSGCGKSTFIRCLNHMNDLVPGARIDGRILYHREEMIRVALDSFRDRNLEGAESLVDLDELVDRANRRVVQHLLELGADPELREYGLRMVVISRALERIGDHAVDIGEQTAYLLTAEFREFTDASHPTPREA